MPRPCRLVQPDLPYHVTQRGNNKQAVFHDDEDRSVYLRLATTQLAHIGVRALAYCLMLNHVHWIVIPPSADSLPLFFGRLHGKYSRYLNAKLNRTGALWQARYYSCALSPQHLRAALYYVEMNPVRANLAKQPEDFAWSSARAHLNGNQTAQGLPLDWEFWQEQGGKSGWHELLGKPPSGHFANALRKSTHAGRPMGDEAFIQAIEQSTGTQWTRAQHLGRRPQSRAAKASG